ncbi:thioredoxin domain-containing protein, partial [Nocardia puris]|uniref:DsbA family protein n=3 Tax=Nocardiaceae TaxID=85025 RepID=UPI001893DAB4
FVEQLRETYSGRVTFVVRYFPIPSHFNAERAARAVEAAAGQGAFEAMYKKMYETQSEWAEQRVPKDDVFRGFASELGLNMTQWDSAYSDPATLQRIKDDVADGRTLGVQGTPTFFLDGVKLQPR